MRSFRHLLALATLSFAASCALAQTVSIPPQSGPTPTVAGRPPASALVDINIAPLAQLMALPGIGDAYTKRIIAGRPYTAKNQLVTRGILPQATYDKISGSIIAKHPAK
jgi:DNA uptake protein ComE-like DNA-binding protein